MTPTRPTRRPDTLRSPPASRRVTVPAIVPVQETEAWLLLDEQAIRRIAGKPNGRRPLNLPSSSALEGKSNPKEILQQAIATASEDTGTRLQKTNGNFFAHRRALLENLSPNGPIRQIPAWQRMRADLEAALNALNNTNSET